MDARLRFVAPLPDGVQMSAVCRSFGISRKTGYKIYNRYKNQELAALSDRSRRPALAPPAFDAPGYQLALEAIGKPWVHSDPTQNFVCQYACPSRQFGVVGYRERVANRHVDLRGR